MRPPARACELPEQALWYNQQNLLCNKSDLHMNANPFFYQETQGIRISVRPLYLEEQSQPILHRYVFAYFIRIENVSQRTVQLLSRHCYIHDSIGEDSEVAGDGVVGQQPTLQPGDVHEYQSF